MESNYIRIIYDGDVNLTIYAHQNTPSGELNQKTSLTLSKDNIKKLADCLNKIVNEETRGAIIDYQL